MVVASLPLARTRGDATVVPGAREGRTVRAVRAGGSGRLRPRRAVPSEARAPVGILYGLWPRTGMPASSGCFSMGFGWALFVHKRPGSRRWLAVLEERYVVRRTSMTGLLFLVARNHVDILSHLSHEFAGGDIAHLDRPTTCGPPAREPRHDGRGRAASAPAPGAAPPPSASCARSATRSSRSSRRETPSIEPSRAANPRRCGK